jgi:hypothetical protein
VVLGELMLQNKDVFERLKDRWLFLPEHLYYINNEDQ